VTQNGHGKAEAQLSDDLIAKARAIASRSDELIELLEDARQRLLEADPEREGAKGRPESKRRFKPNPTASKGTSKAKVKTEGELSDGLRLLTSQMSAAGADRQEIADCLRRDFAIENPEPILKSMGL
jgi:hypothetical protein